MLKTQPLLLAAAHLPVVKLKNQANFLHKVSPNHSPFMRVIKKKIHLKVKDFKDDSGAKEFETLVVYFFVTQISHNFLKISYTFRMFLYSKSLRIGIFVFPSLVPSMNSCLVIKLFNSRWIF